MYFPLLELRSWGKRSAAQPKASSSEFPIYIKPSWQGDALRKGMESVKVWQQKNYFFLPALGRLAPYLERDCIRFCTPWVSRVPRMMW